MELIVIEHFSWFDARWEKRGKKKQPRGQLSSQLKQIMGPWRALYLQAR